MSLTRYAVQVHGQHVKQEIGVFGSPGYNSYQGYMVPDVHIRTGTIIQPTLPAFIPNTTLVAKGVQGWNRFKPTHQGGSLGQAIGELREGFPIKPQQIMRLREAAKSLKHLGRSVGDAHLGAVFGVLPIISDIKDLVHNVRNLDKNIKQLARDNGRTVRRNGRVDVSESHSDSYTEGSGQNSFIYPPIHVGLWATGTKSKKWTSVSTNTEYRFSGRFRYWIDPARMGYKGIPDRYSFQLERILFGLDPSDPSLYYELMPWSWLIDWVVPVGPMLENFFNDSLDNLVADYAYISCHSRSVEDVKVESLLRDGTLVALHSLKTTEVKQRVAANPYGFGIDFSGLSTRKLAILASLGLTKLNSN
jgi:hypothetical protein